MHSASMTMSNADFLAHTDAMVALLQDPLFLDKIKQAQDAVKNIQKIIQVDFRISENDEFRVLTEKTTSLNEQSERMQEEINTLKIKYTELEKSCKTMSNRIEKEASKTEKALEDLQSEIKKKEDLIEKLDTQLKLVKKLIKKDNELYKKMDIRVRDVEVKLDKTTTEFNEVKQSHISLKEQVQQIQKKINASDSTNAAQMKEEICSLEKQNSSLANEVIELRTRNEELIQQINVAQQDQGDNQTRARLFASEQTNKSLADKNDMLKSEVKQLQNELRESKQHKIDETEECTKTPWQSKIEALEFEIEELKTNQSSGQNKDLTKDLFYERNAKLETQLTCSNNDLKALESQTEKLKHAIEVKKNEIRELKNALLEKDVQIKKYEVETETLKNTLSEKEVLINQFETETSEKEFKLKDKIEKIKEYKAETETFKTILSDNDKLIKQYEAETKSFKKQVNDLQRQTAETEFELKDKFKEIKALTSEKEKLQRDIENVAEKSSEYRQLAEAKIDSLNSYQKQLERELEQTQAELYIMEEHTALKTKDTDRDVTTDIKAVVATQINVKLPDDNVTPWVSGAKFLTNGDLVLCDGKNKRIKLLSKSFDVKESIAVHAQPWDVAELDSNTMVVTLPFAKQIAFIQIQPLSEKRAVKTEKMYWGIQVHNGEIFATHLNKLGEGGVVVLDVEGNVKRSIDSDIKYINPENLTIDKKGHIVVSDNDSHRVTIMDQDGLKIEQYITPELQSPGGVCHDRGGNIIVCGSGSNNLLVFTAEKKPLTIQTHTNPISVAYSQEDDILVIGFDSDKLLVLEVKGLF